MSQAKIGFFNSIYKSIVNFGFYKEISNQPVSKSIGYLSVLILCVALLLIVRYSVDFSQFIDNSIKWYDQTIGKIEIQKGKVVFDKPQPFQTQRYGFTFGIDTTGKTSSVEGDWGLLFTKDKLYYKDKSGQVNTYDLSRTEHLVVDKTIFTRLKDVLFVLACLIMFIGVYIGAMVAKFFQVFLVSLFSLIMNVSVGANLKYKNLFNIGIYALTPSIILGVINTIFKLYIPFFWIIYCGVYMIYIIMGITNTKSEMSAS